MTPDDDARAAVDLRRSARAKLLAEAEQTMVEVEAAKLAERQKTERLRALRLAKEEAERGAAPAAKGRKTAAGKPRVKPAASGR